MHLLFIFIGAVAPVGGAVNAASCLHSVCAEEISGCTRRGDCATLFTCVGEGNCALKLPADSSVSRCLASCGNSTLGESEVEGKFRTFWESRNAVAEKQLRSFKPANIEFFFPEVRPDPSASTLRRRLLQNSKTRLLKLVDQLAAGGETSDATALLETDKSTFAGFRQLRDKIERDVEDLLKRDI